MRVCVVDPDISRRRVALLDFPFPFDVPRRAFLIVKVAAEGQGEAFIESSLVEVESFFKRREVAGYERGTGKENGGFDFVGGVVGA